jgi:hypothetical protein
MRTRYAPLLAALLGAVASGPLSAQATALYTRWNAVTGFDFQSYHFQDNTFGVKTASQWNLPLVVVAPLGRQMSLDLTTHLAHATVSSYTTATSTLSGLTDTQLRLLYTLGRDRAVASLALNLPTGKHSVSTSEFAVCGAVGSNFLSFPVASCGTGFGVTGGLAYATPAGAWNLGFSGSVRYQGSYQPFSDQSLDYAPGVEGRVRAAADRLLGQRARLLLGLTFSTFSTDQYTGSGIVNGSFTPGPRFIGDLGYAYSFGQTTVAITAWDFYRLSSSSADTTIPGSKENVFNAELRAARQVSPRFALEPVIGFRQWSPGDYRGGRLFVFGANARLSFSDQLSAQLSGRFGPGWAYEPSHGRGDLTATGVTLYLRYQR